MRPRSDVLLFLVLLSIPMLIQSFFFADSPCITTTENPLKVHFQDEPICSACLALHGAGRIVLGHPLSPVRFLLNTGCGFIPPCTILWTIVSFYFSVTTDRLSCRRVLVCPGDWFDENKSKRSINLQQQQSRELYNILVGKAPYYHFDQGGKSNVDEIVIDAVRNVTRAFGVTDKHKTDIFASMVVEATRRVNGAYHYVNGQLDKDKNHWITG